MNKDKINDDEEETFDPRKLFDESQYSTLIIDREGFSKKQNSAADLIEELLEPNLTRPQYEEIFKGLKEHDARELLVDAIKEAPDQQKRIITAACWESGLDFSPHFLFFSDLVISSPFEVAMEAFTVIEEMLSEPSPQEVTQVLRQIRTSREHKNAMVAELLVYLTSKQH
jgi:hypothetical protein